MPWRHMEVEARLHSFFTMVWNGVSRQFYAPINYSQENTPPSLQVTTDQEAGLIPQCLDTLEKGLISCPSWELNMGPQLSSS